MAELEYVMETIYANMGYIIFVAIIVNILAKVIKYGFIYLIVSAISRHECRKMMEVARHGKKAK